MTESYDLRSNIKAKPGSQGTLFQVKDKGLLNPHQRWPRGYGPERQSEVREALKPVAVTGHDGDEHWTPMDIRRGLPATVDYPRKRAQVVDTVARSTMPVSDLQGLKEIHNTPEPNHYATYWNRRKTIGIDLDDHDRAGSTPGEDLIHEIGHHVDHAHDTGWRLSQRLDQEKPSNFARLTGIQEAVADNYMTEHYRTPGRSPQPVTTGSYEHTFTPHELDTEVHGYTDVRPQSGHNLSPSQFSAQVRERHATTDTPLPGMADHAPANDYEAAKERARAATLDILKEHGIG